MIFCGIFGLAQGSQASEYYVSPSGNNASSGSISAPWLTIQKAANTMVAGDTVYIKAGTYTERVTPQHSGSSGSYITYQNYPGHVPVIQTPNSQAEDCGFCMKDNITLSYIKIVGLKVINANYANIDVRASVAHPKSNIIIDGLTIQGSFKGIYFRMGVTDSKIINNTVFENQFGLAVEYKNNNILINNNHISFGKIQRADIETFFANNIVVAAYGLPNSPNTNITISNNEVDHAKVQGIVVWEGDNIWVTGNNVHHNGATGIQIEGNNTEVSYDVVVENNTCEYNGATNDWETGIWIDDTDRALVQNNIVRFNKNGMYITGTTNLIVRNNLIYGNTKYYGIQLYQSPQRGPNNNVIIVHNTLYKNSGDAAVSMGIWNETLKSTNLVFKNNIVADSIGNFDLATRTDSIQLNYNKYYNSTRALSFMWNGTSGYNFSGYKTASGQDSNSIISNPLFIDQVNGDFHLQSGSPCINSGDYLTRTTASGSGTSLVVSDARHFNNGYGIVAGDLIIVGSNSPVRVTNVDYDTNTITVNSSVSWNNGDGVSYSHSSSKPDIGAYEYVGATDITPPTSPTGLSVQ